VMSTGSSSASPPDGGESSTTGKNTTRNNINNGNYENNATRVNSAGNDRRAVKRFTTNSDRNVFRSKFGSVVRVNSSPV